MKIKRPPTGFICISKQGCPVMSTFSLRKERSIRLMIGANPVSWREFKIKHGYSCKKVRITVELDEDLKRKP